MKRLLALTLSIAILLLPLQGYAARKKSTLTQVASGSITQANMRLSGVDGGATASGGAFVDFTAANILTTKLGNLLEIFDSSNRKISGWIKAAGTGETVGAELVTDPGFAAVTKAAAKSVSGITKANPGVVTFAAGHGYANGDIIYFSGLTQMTELNTQYWQLRASSGDTFQLATVYNTTSLDTSAYGGAETTGGNCAQSVTFTSWTQGTAFRVGVDGAGALLNRARGLPSLSANLSQTGIFSSPSGKLYKLGYDIKSRTTGSIANFPGGTTVGLYKSTVADGYVDYRTGLSTWLVGMYYASLLFDGTIDNVTVKQGLTPSATGCTIVNSKGGVTYNFAFKNASFNWNDTAGYTYKIWKSTVAPVVATADVTQANFHADTTTDNAFVELVGVDLTAYQTGKYLLGVYNKTGGYGMLGHISATAPAGESLDTEFMTNSNFDLGDTGWDKETGYTIVDQGAGDYQGVGTNVGNGFELYKTKTTAVSGWLMKNSVVCSSFTDGSLAAGINISGGTRWGNTLTGTGTSDVYSTLYSTTHKGACTSKTAGSDFKVSSISAKRVLDPPSTGAKIVSTKGGAGRTWFYKHASFNPNDAAGQTYAIIYIGD